MTTLYHTQHKQIALLSTLIATMLSKLKKFRKEISLQLYSHEKTNTKQCHKGENFTNNNNMLIISMFVKFPVNGIHVTSLS